MVQGAHLVGSVPLSDAEAVFRTVSGSLGSRLRAMPDGETGPRSDWIAWQYAVMAATPGLEPVPAGDRGYLRRQLVRLDRGHRGEVHFGPLGYADAALASFALFERMERDGVIPSGMRFQVSLPTPLAPVTVFVDLPDRAVVEPAYEAALLGELQRIAAGIPHDRLAVQWDVAAELGHLEGIWPAHFDDVEGGVLARLARLAEVVPAGATLGYHLCYGDFGHRHFVTPGDAGRLVRLANAVVRPRAPAWLHMPVPIGWTAPPAYAPLAALALPAQTHVYLGLVHLADGVEGARRRIALAERSVARFGVATECGWGRRPRESVSELLRLHAELAAPIR